MTLAPRNIPGHRVIDDLRVCALLSARPKFIPRPGGKGSKALGRTYQNKVGKFIRRKFPDLVTGQWFEYVDANGRGWCETDHYLVFEDQVILFECKLTQTHVAFLQMDELYKPILRKIYGKPVTGVQVCKHLTERGRSITDVREALIRPGSNLLWHCLV